MFPVIGLLPRARGHPFDRGFRNEWLGYHNSIQLSGESRVPRLARYTVWLTAIPRPGALWPS